MISEDFGCVERCISGKSSEMFLYTKSQFSEVRDMAKKRKDLNTPPDPSDDEILTTVKARRRVARLIKMIGAHMDLNQEDVLELFEDAMRARLRKLMEEQLGH